MSQRDPGDCWRVVWTECSRALSDTECCSYSLFKPVGGTYVHGDSSSSFIGQSLLDAELAYALKEMVISKKLSLAVGSRPTKQPPSDYVCHLCLRRQHHFIKDCPSKHLQEDMLTPYAGKKRCFGHFKCHKCKRKWVSGSSWANQPQSCYKCHVVVYPYKQRRLQKPGEEMQFHSDVHPQELCQMCQLLGFYCGRMMKRR